jgi:hypothetical protein
LGHVASRPHGVASLHGSELVWKKGTAGMKNSELALRLRLPWVFKWTYSKEIVRIPTALPTNMCAIPRSVHLPQSNWLERCWLADEKKYELVH